MSSERSLQYPHTLPGRIHLGHHTQERRRTTKQIVKDGDGNTVAWLTTYSDQTEIADFMVCAYNERRAEFAQEAPDA